MESTVELIMTGTADINQVLKSNKDKIQSLNSTLESIIHKGYFEIIKNTETLQSLSFSQEIPQIILPSPIDLHLPTKENQQLPFEDQIWDLINLREYTKAAELTIKSSSKSVNRIKKLLISPFFFNVFTLQDRFIDRIMCLDVLETDNIDRLKRITKFIIDQLVQILKEKVDFESNFQKSRYIFNEIFGNDAEKEVEIKSVVQEVLNTHLPEIKAKIMNDLEKTTKISELETFISTSVSSYGIPTVWDLISNEWEQKAYNLLKSQLSFTPYPTLKETLKNYESQTSEIVSLFKTYTQILNYFHLNIQKNLPDIIISSIPSMTSPLLILGFFTYFKELSVFSIFPALDFSEFISETEKIVSELLDSKDILSICMEIRSICGDKSLSLPSLKVKFGQSQSGFGVLVGKEAENWEVGNLELPKPLQMIPRVQLPLTLSTHLLLT